MNTRGILVGVFLLLSFSLHGQQGSLRVGAGLNGITYLGDLNEPGFGIWRVSAGGEFSLERPGEHLVGMSFHAGFGQFTEQWDTPDNQPGTRFVQTPFLHGDFRVHIRPTLRVIQPYLSLGAGLLSFTPKDEDGVPLSEGNYNTMIPQLPMSAGVRWQINPSIGFDLSYTWRFTPTDFLDNIGNEGARSGFDALHAVNIAVQFDLFRDDPPALPDSILDEPAQALAQDHWIDSSAVSSAISSPQEGGESVGEEHEISVADEQAEDNAASLYDREMALQSIDDGHFLYYESKSRETIEELAIRFRVPPDLIREINFLSEDTMLKKGTYLRIPLVVE